MTTWTSEELTRVRAAEELEIAFLRRDGTLGRPRTIWVVPYRDKYRLAPLPVVVDLTPG